MTDIYSLLGTSGGAFAIGLITGFSAKKLINVFAVIVGVQIAFLTYLEHINILSINWEFIERILSVIQDTITTLRFPETVETYELYEASGAVGGFVIGTLIGFFYV